jgi:hypothetical protein
MKSKVTLTVNKPDSETVAWFAGKMRRAHMRELDDALTKAQKALREGRSTTIRTKPMQIEISLI